MSNGKLYVTIGYGDIKKTFVARVVQDKDTIKTKSIGLKNKTWDQAYNEIIVAAKLFAKQYKCEFKHKSKDQLLGTGSDTNKENTPKKIGEENPLITKFGNELAFKAMIKHAIKLHGIEKVLEVLDSASTLTKNMQSEINKQKTIVSAANIKIARVIIETRNQGVHMDAPTKEIEAAVQWVMENDSKPKTPSRAEPNVTYKLGEEEWNGVGHAPAGFSKYLNQNENHSLDDLRVN